MHTITLDGVPTGNYYYGLTHAMRVAKRMATNRRKKGEPTLVAVLDTSTGLITPVTES